MENETTTKNLIPSSKVYVYEIDNRINGFIGTLDNYIAGLFVAEDHQSKGIGKALLNQVKRSNSELTLNVYSKNKRALEFYTRQGFEQVSKNIDTNTNELEIMMTWKG